MPKRNRYAATCRCLSFFEVMGAAIIGMLGYNAVYFLLTAMWENLRR